MLELTEESLEQLRSLRGLVATVVLSGTVEADYAAAHEEMRVFNVMNGFRNIEYRKFHAVLVESGRDECAAHALANGYDWVLQIDADAAPFHEATTVALLKRAYLDAPESDAVGAYCQLRQNPYLPTIDTGTGTWEEHYPGEGMLRVIRTGAHCLLTKTRAYRVVPYPWHRTRVAMRSVDVVAEFDNLARRLLHGKNPLEGTRTWEVLVEAVKAESGGTAAPVGEDSAFCDALTAAGGVIYVDTDLVVGHLARVNTTPEMLREEMERRRRITREAHGILG